MNYSNFIASLDIGSSKITLTLATLTTQGEINVIDTESSPTTSVKYGKITNENAVAKTIQALVLKVQQRQGAIIEKVYVTTAGTMLSCETKTLEKELGEGSIITTGIVDNLTDMCNATINAENEQVLSITPITYKVDGELTEEAIGKAGHRLQGTFLIVKGNNNSIDKIHNTLKIAEIRLAEMFISPLAIAEATLTAKEKTQGTAAIEIGQSSTKITIYQGNKVRFLSTIPLGSQLISNDLSACLNISYETADLLKKDNNFGAVCANLVEDADIILKMTNGIKKNQPSRTIVEIIEARMEEILLNVMHQIEKSGFMYLLSGGLVISGGVVGLRNLTQFIKLKTNLNARIADVKPLFAATSKSDINTPDYAETCGMILLGQSNCKKVEKTERTEKTEEKETRKEKKKPKKSFIPRGMGDLFAGFFEETDESID